MFLFFFLLIFLCKLFEGKKITFVHYNPLISLLCIFSKGHVRHVGQSKRIGILQSIYLIHGQHSCGDERDSTNVG